MDLSMELRFRLGEYGSSGSFADCALAWLPNPSRARKGRAVRGRGRGPRAKRESMQAAAIFHFRLLPSQSSISSKARHLFRRKSCQKGVFGKRVIQFAIVSSMVAEAGMRAPPAGV